MLFSVFENVAKAFTLFPFLDSDRYALAYLGYVCAGICYLLLLLCIAQVVLKMNPHLFYVTSAVVFYILYAMSTILYIPFLGVMLNLLTCERANGGYVAYYDNSCGCYSGYHLTLGILGIFTTVVLFVLSLACKAFVFPIKVTAHDPVARLDYSSHPLFHVLRTVLLCALLMFPESSQKVIYLAIELGVTVGLYAIHYFIQMIYSDFAERTMRLLKGFNVWLVFVGGILYVSGTPFTASFIMAVLGGWAMLWLDFYADRGLFSILERAATSPKSIYNFVSVMQMIAMGKKASREWDYLMNCYTCYHFGTCMVGPAAQGTAANVNTEMERRAEVLEGLSQSVNRRLKVEMLLNPTDTMLRMFAVGYILYNTHNYMLAFEIIKGSEVLDLSYQHQFIMRVYWKKLEKKIAKLARTQGTQIDVFDVIKRDKSQNKFCDTIESCAMLREHFYDLLVDNEPSYEKFVMLGFAIKQTSARIKELWHSLKRSNTRLSLRMIVAYSGYHEQILQDAERAAKLRSNMLEEGVITEGDMLMQYAENGDAVAAVTTDSEGHATIVKHNCAFSELSGYTKEELANMPLERLIPKVCLPIHEAAFNKAVVMARSEKPMSFEQRPTVMLHRSGYIVPVIQRVVATPSYINSYCFIVKICKDKANNVYNLVHILADEARNIVGLSSSNEPNNRCIDASTMCGLSLDIINSTRINIYQLSADFLSIPEKTKVEINYNDNVQLLMSGTIDSLGKELISPIFEPKTVRHIQTAHRASKVECEYRSLCPAGEAPTGYYYKLWFVDDSLFNETAQTVTTQPLELQFAYNPIYNGFYVAGSATKRDQDTILYNHQVYSTISSREKSPAEHSTGAKGTSRDPPVPVVDEKKARKDLPEFFARLAPNVERMCHELDDWDLLKTINKKINYAKDVTTYRISNKGMMKVTNNMITMDIEGSCSMQGVSEEVSTREFNKENEALVCNAIKSRKNVKRAMKSLSMPSIFWKLYVTCFILFSAAAGISITEHVLFVNIFNELADQVDTIAHQSDEYRCITESASITMQMASVSEGILDPQNAYPQMDNATALLTWTQARIKSLAFELLGLVNTAEDTKNAKLVKQKYSTIQDFYYNYTNVWIRNSSYAAAVSMTIVEMLYILQIPTAGDFKIQNQHVATLIYNALNGLFESQKTSLNALLDETQTNFDNEKAQSALIFYLFLGAYILLVVAQAPLGYHIIRSANQEAMPFLSISRRHYIKMVKEANSFLIYIRDRTYEKEFDSNDELDDLRERMDKSAAEREATSEQILKDRAFSRTLCTKLAFVWRIVLNTAVTLGYIVAIYTTSTSYYNFLFKIVQLSNSTARIDMVFSISELFHRTLFYNSDYSIDLTSDAYTMAVKYESRVADLTKSVYYDTLPVLGKFKSANEERVTSYYFRTMCRSDMASLPSDEQITTEDCEDPIPEKGMASVMSEFMYIQRSLLLKYEDDSSRAEVFNDDDFYRYARGIDWLYYSLVRPGYKYVFSVIQDEISVQNSSRTNILLIVLVIFVSFTTLYLTIVWIPYIVSSANEIKKLRLLICTLPVPVILKTRRLKEFFARIMFKHKG